MRWPRAMTTKFGRVDAMIAEDLFRDALVLAKDRPVEPQPVKGTPCISRNETMFWSKPRLFLNWSARLKMTSGAKLCSFCRSRSRSSKIARCSVGMAECAERGHDVGLGLPVLGLQLRAQVLIDRRRRDGVEEGEDFEFLLHVYFVRLNLPVKR